MGERALCPLSETAGGPKAVPLWVTGAVASPCPLPASTALCLEVGRLTRGCLPDRNSLNLSWAWAGLWSEWRWVLCVLGWSPWGWRGLFSGTLWNWETSMQPSNIQTHDPGLVSEDWALRKLSWAPGVQGVVAGNDWLLSEPPSRMCPPASRLSLSGKLFSIVLGFMQFVLDNTFRV